MNRREEGERLPPDIWDEPSMIGYLLGRMQPDAAAALETAYFSDEQLYARLCSVETELIDSYLRGELAGDRARQFETAYSGDTPRGRRLAAEREWFEAARLVREHKRLETASPRKWTLRGVFSKGAALRFTSVAASLIAAVVSIWAAHRIIVMEASVRELRSSLQSRTPALPPLPSFVLLPGLTRGSEGPKRIQFPRDAEEIRFELRLDQPANIPLYAALYRIGDNNEVWSGKTYPAGDISTVTVPAAVLTRNDYKLTLATAGAGGAAAAAPSYIFSIAGTY